MDDRFHRFVVEVDPRRWAVGFAWAVFAQFGDRTIREVVVYLGPVSVNVLIGDLAPADQEDTDASS